MEDYLTNPDQESTMPRNRSKSVSSRLTLPEVVKRNTPLRASSFSPGSVAVRERLCFPKLSFRSRSTSVSSLSSSSLSSSTSQTSGNSEKFWNQYRRSRPTRSSFTKLLRKALTNSQANRDRQAIPVDTEYEEYVGNVNLIKEF